MRYYPLEYGKAYCLIALIILHTLIWFLAKNNRSIPVGEIASEVILVPYLISFGLVGLFLPAISGMSLAERFYLKGGQKRFLLSETIRGLIIVVIGVVGHPEGWEALSFIGISSILFSICLNVGGSGLVALVTFLVCAIQSYVRSSSYLWNSEWIKIILVGNNYGKHFWPLLPWLSSVGFGFLFMYFRIIAAKEYLHIYRKIVGIFGVILVSVACLSKDYFVIAVDKSNLWGPTMFQPPMTAFLGWMGIFLLFLLGFDLLFEGVKPNFTSITNIFSNGMLYIFLVHYLGFSRLVQHLSGSRSAVTLCIFMLIQFVFLYWMGRFILERKYRRSLS